MKKQIIFTIAVMCIPYFSLAQDKIGSIGIGIGGASVNEKDSDGLKSSGFGFNFYLNGMYNLNERISAGVEFNSNIAIINSFNITGIEVTATIVTGILAKGKYVFGEGSIKPYLGFMFGLYNIRPGGFKFSLNGSTPVELNFEKRGSFGFAPEFGAQFRSFQLSTSFHVPGKYKANLPDGNGGTNYLELQYFIWQFNLGWNIDFGNK